MRTRTYFREALASAWANKIPATLVLLLVAAMCAGTLATVGRSAQAEADVLERVDAAGSRLLTVSSRPQDHLLTEAVISQTAGITGIERAGGISETIDVTNAAIGDSSEKVAGWRIVGDVHTYADLISGRWPGAGEALISEQAAQTLGMSENLGAVVPASTQPGPEWTIVGTYRAKQPFSDYGNGVISPSADAPAMIMHVILTDVATARATEPHILRLIASPDPALLTIDSPIGLAELQQQIETDLGTFSRTLLLGVLGSGALLVSIVAFADVLIRRSDLGRRRALGATRSTITALVMGRNTAPALLGAALGTVAGLIFTYRAGQVPPLEFTIGTAALSILAAILGSAIPAVFAATRDPVRILRTP